MSSTAAPAPTPLPVETILNAADTLEIWLRRYPEWVAVLSEEPGATGPAISLDSLGYGGHSGNPTENAAVERADAAIRVAAIQAGLVQLPERLREIVEMYYFSGIYQRRRRRNAALAHLLAMPEIHSLLTS